MSESQTKEDTDKRERYGCEDEDSLFVRIELHDDRSHDKEEAETHSDEEGLYGFGIFIVDTSDDKLISFEIFCDICLIVFASGIEFFEELGRICRRISSDRETDGSFLIDTCDRADR